jgi:aminobenzoyl-glutamate utilization protein B
VDDLSSYIENNRDRFISLSDRVWEYAETRFAEHNSVDLLVSAFEEEGFTVERGIGNIPTAFVATYGSGGPVIALLGEYDALAGLSQNPVPHRDEREKKGNGHGCGHNLLGVGSLAAAFAVKQAIVSGEVQGTIRFYGCPAEEGGAGKTFMVQRGVFDDVDAAITWHPAMMNSVFTFNVLARSMIIFKFQGISAHAAANPFNGRSALDAVELMNVGANYLREHIVPEARMHYVITDGGGISPNVVPATASSLYYVRAPRTSQVKEIEERLFDVARGAALMTGTEVEIIFHSGTSNLLLNETLEERLYHNLVKVGSIPFDESDEKFAAEIANSFVKGGGDMLSQITAGIGRGVAQEIKEKIGGKVLNDEPLPYFRVNKALSGSTDVGDVSWIVPTAQLATSCSALGTAMHSWQLVAQGGMSIGHKGMLHAAKVMALTTADLLKDPQFLADVKAEFAAKIAEDPYVSPLPPNAPLP